MNRILDAVSVGTNHNHKLLLVAEGHRYEIVDQIHGRKAKSGKVFGTSEAAMAFWQKALADSFYAITRNLKDSQALAARRVSMLF